MCSQEQTGHVLSTALRATFATSKLGTHPAAPTVAPAPTEKSVLWLLRLKKGREEIASWSDKCVRVRQTGRDPHLTVSAPLF